MVYGTQLALDICWQWWKWSKEEDEDVDNHVDDDNFDDDNGYDEPESTTEALETPGLALAHVLNW